VADSSAYLELARSLAKRAGDVLLDGRPDPARNFSLETSSKSSPTDLVSEKDLASEKEIVEGILAQYPLDGIVGEEGTNRPSESGINWIIDPLDGTINYIYGASFWSISIAVAKYGLHKFKKLKWKMRCVQQVLHINEICGFNNRMSS
jgi:myo-inositol-1(or 4)-monophosphatase